MTKQNKVCIGCGVCAGVCPSNALKMEFNKYGEYNPVQHQDCAKKCNLCLQVCPFSKKGDNEDTLASAVFGNIDGIKHRLETGYYLGSYVGYSRNHRANGASGGLTTWLLETLFLKNIIDYVVCVIPHNDPEKLFRFTICNSIELIRSSAGSVCYPVEVSEVIKYVIENEGRYAITGLPCFIKGLRLAAKKNKKLRERIIITVGLVCGQMKSKYYTFYLASLSGVSGGLKSVNYKGKGFEKPGSNIFFHCINKKNHSGKLFWNEGIGKVWNNRWFTPEACNFCDDVFAELADVALMDAWLPEYSKDWKGTNLVIVRAPIIRETIEAGIKEGQLKASRISIDKTIQAQAGILNIKKKQLSYRLHLAQKNGVAVPAKRVAPLRKIGFVNKKEVVLKDKMQRQSRELFLKCFNKERVNLKAFSEEMNCLIREMQIWVRIGRIWRLPGRIIKKIAKNVNLHDA